MRRTVPRMEFGALVDSSPDNSGLLATQCKSHGGKRYTASIAQDVTVWTSVGAISADRTCYGHSLL